MEATLVTVVSGLLMLFFPPVVYISNATIALVTLRSGPYAGVALIGASWLCFTACLWFFWQESAILLSSGVAILWIPIWLLANVLRRTISMSGTLLSAAALSMAGVVLFYLVTQDPSAWWQGEISRWVDLLAKQLPAKTVTLNQVDIVNLLASLMTGVLASTFLLGCVLSLFIARWWQALLYNQGGFRQEFIELRSDWRLAILATLLLFSAIWFSGTPGKLANDLAMIIMTLYFIQGLAVVHGILHGVHAHWGWLISLYAMLLIVPTQTIAGVSALGFADGWLNLRRFIQTKG